MGALLGKLKELIEEESRDAMVQLGLARARPDIFDESSREEEIGKAKGRQIQLATFRLWVEGVEEKTDDGEEDNDS